MRNIIAIFKKEFRAYFDSPIAYIFITAFLISSMWIFFRGFFLIGQAMMRGYFSLLPWFFLFFVPAITMRLWAEEKKAGTIEVLMTLPVKDYEVTLGKYLAAFLFLGLTILLSATLPVTLIMLGQPDLGPIIGGYIGALLMGGAYLAIGLFASSLSENQIVAFILGIFFCFCLFIIGENFVIMAIPSRIAMVFSYIGLGHHFESIGRGVLDTRDIVYYISVIGFFLFLNIRSLESRKWS
ncbi:ABC transporter permease [bacterium]|nr:ABC transporter permease [bacterium]